MFGLKFRFLEIALCVVGTTSSLFGGNFAAPAEGPVAFRRDRLPLDTDSMVKLSSQLSILADGIEGENPKERRCAAQMLALSLALDPANSKARTMIGQFEKDRHHAELDQDKARKGRARIWHYLGWLETPEAGPDGQALAACLKDVMAISDPEDSRSEVLLAKGETGAWTGWIAGANAYGEAKPVNVNTPPEVPKNQPTKPGILLTDASVLTPLWNQKPGTEPAVWELAPTSLKMTAGVKSGGEDADRSFSVAIGDNEDHHRFFSVEKVVLKVMKKLHGDLSDGGFIRIETPHSGATLPRGRRQAISGAAAVLADSAITGREPDAAIIGIVDENGAFSLPKDFWQQLRSVENEPAMRIIVPAAAAGYLPSMLALENPQFFIKHEVLIAGNFKNATELAAKVPDKNLDKILSLFREIQEKAGNQPLGQYVANSYVRRRLAELSQAAPFHVSAKMLAIQGAGDRPIYISHEVLLSELLRAIEPLKWIARRDFDTLQPEEIQKIAPTYEGIHNAVDSLTRYCEKGDREMVSRVADMVALIRSFDRAARSRPNSDDWDPSRVARSAFNTLGKAYTNVTEELSPDDQEAAPVQNN
jgi:hypothetical protein